MNFIDLFSGIGGFSLGLERAGMTCVAQVEINQFCLNVLNKNFPNVPRFKDVKDFNRGSIEEEVDLICGGFPCQPFSSASRGRKRGTEDTRWLWPEMFRTIQEFNPTWVIGENVTQFDGPALEKMVLDLEKGGYETITFEIPACAFGYDHFRPRLWILGHSNSQSKPRSTVNAKMAGVPWINNDSGGMGKKDGVSNRMDRLRALGNSVVPDIPEFIGRYIIEVENEKIKEK